MNTNNGNLNDEITPKKLYQNRREFLKSAGLLSGSALLAACAPNLTATPTDQNAKQETIDNLTAYESATGYINFYEFSLSKDGIGELAKDFKTEPWSVEIKGLVGKPQKFSLAELQNNFTQEERVYRMRCVEGWSMVLPWRGFPLWKLLDLVEPLPDAKYVGFKSVLRPEEMPGQRSLNFPWPYLEGLRLDEARHDLTILATGMYGEPLRPQNGAPVRLVVPWKYGFKSIKSIVEITLVDTQPVTLWNAIGSEEYGFYANVNPNVPHPRWLQDTERRIGEPGRRPTLLHNGYADEVAYLYEGMDLTKFY